MALGGTNPSSQHPAPESRFNTLISDKAEVTAKSKKTSHRPQGILTFPSSRWPLDNHRD
jgi:hypothetical protein